MAQNFKRRISLFPETFGKFQNSLEKLSDINLAEKADKDTFNKSVINKNTPKKEKKVKKSLLDTPSIEDKKYRKISIYSPISFGDMSTPVSKKNISEFNSQIFSEDEIELNTTFNSSGYLSFLPCGKFKKLDNRYKNKNILNKNIMLKDENDKNYSFRIYYDKDIYEKNDTLKNDCNINNNKIKNVDENSDDEEIEQKHDLCINELGKAIDYFNDNPKFFSEMVNKRKKYF